MTEYGRGAGSEPWHPEDPLYGDQGWGGQQDASGQTPYNGQAQQYAQAQQYDQYGNPVYSPPQDPYQQQYPQQQGQYPQDPQQHGAGQGQYGQGQYGQNQGQVQYGRDQQQYPQDPNQQQYAQNSNAQQYPPTPHQQAPDQQAQYQQQYGQPPYQQDAYPQQAQPQQNGGWDGAAQTGVAYGADPHTPYGGQPVHHNGENPDFYRTPDAYPPPQPPGRRDEWQQEPPAEPEAEPQHEPETHPFFTGADSPVGGGGDDDDYDDDPAETRDGTRDRRGKSGKPKRRNGCACFVVSLVMVAGLGGVGYVGYSFYQSRYAPPPDYTGVGSTPVEVEVPQGTGLGGIGRLLKQKGVVKSVQAFVTAAGKNPKGKALQAGVYSLNQQMSAANAVTAMVDPNSLNQLIIPPGWRNANVYAAIDKRLELKAGTTAGVARSQADKLGLPGWAKGHKNLKDPLEGFLAPASYPIAKGMKPEDLLKKMVGQSDKTYGDDNLVAAAHRLGLKDSFQVVTVASMLQAEGKTNDDFRRMAEVIYNRLKPSNLQNTNQRLQFDSTYNYLKGQSKINIGSTEINKNTDPYNTYKQRGLPPGPIGNPGKDAMAAALNPTKDGYYFFVSIDGHQTEFAKTYAEFMKLKTQFDAKQSSNG